MDRTNPIHFGSDFEASLNSTSDAIGSIRKIPAPETHQKWKDAGTIDTALSLVDQELTGLFESELAQKASDRKRICERIITVCQQYTHVKPIVDELSKPVTQLTAMRQHVNSGRNLNRLLQDLEYQSILDCLPGKGLLEWDEREDIESTVKPSEKRSKLIDHMCSKLTEEQVVQVLLQTGQEHLIENFIKNW